MQLFAEARTLFLQGQALGFISMLTRNMSGWWLRGMGDDPNMEARVPAWKGASIENWRSGLFFLLR